MIIEKPYKLGIALSGGGIRGLCHAGVLKALDEFDIKPDLLSGVSAGALVGALYADGYTPDEIALLFEDISFRKMTKLQIPNGGLFSIKEFERFMGRSLRAKRFEDLKIPLYVVATDLDNGRSVEFSSGILIHPVVASCSVPVLFMPKKIRGVHYVDGGVFKNFPVSTIRPYCEKVIGINASPLVADEYKLSLKNVAQRTYHFMFKANIVHDKELCDLLIEPVDMAHYEMFDIAKGREIFELGYQSAKKMLTDQDLQIGIISEFSTK
ncbi:MAG: patatin-like phospholipase family protein [Paludibacter sp.]|nr:patatin-like phospholipase family protein [Paludibacter sp.]